MGSETEATLGAWPTRPAEPYPAAPPESTFLLSILHFIPATATLSGILLTCLAHGGLRAFVLAVSSAWNAFPHLLPPDWFITPFRYLFCHLLQEALLHLVSTGGTFSPPSCSLTPLPDFVPFHNPSHWLALCICLCFFVCFCFVVVGGGTGD